MGHWDEEISSLPIPQIHWLTTSANTIAHAIILGILVHRVTASSLFASRCAHLSFPARLRTISPATFFLWAMFFTSWTLVAFIDLFQTMFDLSEKRHCNLVLSFCLLLYSAIKCLLYSFLIERAHVVHGGPRCKDPFYIANLALLSLFGVLVLASTLIRYLKAWHGHCYIGWEDPTITAATLYDISVNLFWSAQFIVPVVRITNRMKHGASGLKNGHELQLRRVAILTALGTIGTLLVTCLNFFLEQFKRPRESVWVCLTVCTFDVTLTCLIMHFVTPVGNGGEEVAVRKVPQEASRDSVRCCCNGRKSLTRAAVDDAAVTMLEVSEHRCQSAGGKSEEVVDSEIQMACCRADFYAE